MNIEQKKERLKVLKLELELSRLPAALMIDKFKEAVLLTIDLTLELSK